MMYVFCYAFYSQATLQFIVTGGGLQVQRIWAGYNNIVGRGVGPLTLNKIGRSAFAVIILLPNNAANSFSAACYMWGGSNSIFVHSFSVHLAKI